MDHVTDRYFNSTMDEFGSFENFFENQENGIRATRID